MVSMMLSAMHSLILNFKMESVVCLISAINFTVIVTKLSISACPKPIFYVAPAPLASYTYRF